MNTHKLLSEYHGHPEYATIAKMGVYMARNGFTAKEILDTIGDHYAPRLRMSEEPKPFNVFGEDMIPENAIEQMETVMRIPPAVRGALMPDAHYGYGVPIGGVVMLDNAISPAFVGYDISCMMQLSVFEDSAIYRFNENPEYFAEILRNETAFGLGAAFEPGRREHPVMDDPRWDSTPFLKSLKPLAQQQLGSSGSGNHFADIMVMDSKHLALLTHSGSRGVGHKFATEYARKARAYVDTIASDIPRGYEWLDLNTQWGQEYLTGMQLLGDYARANHDLIHYHFAKSAGLYADTTIQNRHNFAWVYRDGSVIHRKGATPAERGVYGIIPGSSGSKSYVVSGLGNPDSLWSTSHGAGRMHSRKQAILNHDRESFERTMEEQGILYYGIAEDETVQAYKNIDGVIAAQEGVLLQIELVLEPRVVVMGGE